MNVNCVVCGQELTDDFGDGTAPNGGTVFIARGNYGSTVWDPGAHAGPYSPVLRVNICDVCLTTAAQVGRVVHVQPVHVPVEIDETLWDPSYELSGDEARRRLADIREQRRRYREQKENENEPEHESDG